MSQTFKRNLGKDAGLDLDTSLDPNLVVERSETIVINNLKPKQNISTLRIIALDFNISNSWFVIAASLSVAIATGGTVSIIYGVLITFFLYACAALTLAELAAIYPTAGGVNILGAQMITSLAQYFLDYVPQTWHVFLIYQAINLFTLGYNIFILNIFPFIHEFGFALILVTFVISTITSLACSEKQSFLVFLCRCIYLGSSAAFNALIGSGILLQMISFAIPAVLLICNKRSSDILTLSRPFKLPSAVGWVANVVTKISALLQLGFFVLPPSIPVTASRMNYWSVILAVVGVLSLINWMIYAKSHYQGPRVEFIEEGQP
ncbi:hypothetical protein NCS52_01397400 [Fusarium sp. LHS14.1]|nr:hypothetical protein NCS52_01397400 [Fusarium sp. LHS14.1]